MEVEKLCQYLNEIGIIEYENINIFLNIYSTLNNKKYSSESDKIIDALKIYLNDNFIRNNQTLKLCQSIVSSYNTYQIISKYKALNNMNIILQDKFKSQYILFFLKLSLYLLNNDSGNKTTKKKILNKKSKSKKNINKFDKNEDDNDNINQNDENIELISSDDERECTFTPHINKNFKGYKKNNINNNIESKVYYSPAFNISAKFPLNKYQNNIYTNQSFSDNNLNNYSYSNLNVSNDNRSNISYNQYGNNYNQFPEPQFNNEYNMNYNNRIYYNDNMNNMLIMQDNNDYNNQNIIMNNQNLYNKKYNNNNYSNISNNNNEKKSDLFFNKELYHIEKVKQKIENMKMEKINKISEECTFKPKINTNYKSPFQIKAQKEKDINNNNNNNNETIQLKNKNDLDIIKEAEKEKIKKQKMKRAQSEKKKRFKIIEDLSLARKKRTEKTKKLMKEKNFTPKITKNDKYKITMSFEDRRLKSIELRNKYKNAKKPENNINEIQNNAEGILSPGEMVRFKDNNNINQNNNINNENIDNVYNNINNKEKQNENNDTNVDKFNIEDNKKEFDDLKQNENENIIKPDENNENNNNKVDFDNKNLISNKDDNDINDSNNENLIGEKNQLLINKLKEEHKIGFKSKKNEAYKEPKISEENSEIDLKSDLNKNNDFSFDNFHIKSKSLKDMLKKKDE